MSDKYLQYVNKIKEALKGGKISVLVGAGFSKNVDLKFPSWDELLTPLVKDLYKDIYSKSLTKGKLKKSDDPSEFDKKFVKKIKEIKSYLEIVDDFIKHKGYREAIDYYIYEQFKDTQKLYSSEDLKIHSALLKLPWNNVYTTNYDNLLEQANQCEDVKNKRDMIAHSSLLSTGPNGRIVKLHGTLDKEMKLDYYNYNFDDDIHCNLIISNDDYKFYPQRHEAFTSLMKISLLQESFCLIGFSADDPNFLDWAEWVRIILKNRVLKEKDKISQDNLKIFFLDVKNDNISPERELFLNNNGIQYLPIKKAIALKPYKPDSALGKEENERLETRNILKQLFNILDPQKPNIDKDDTLAIKNNYRNYLQKFSLFSKYTIGSENYYDSIKFLIDNEIEYFLPNELITFNSEPIKRKLIAYLIDNKNALDASIALKYFSFLAFLTRQNFYNLVSVFDGEGTKRLEEIIPIFDSIDYLKIKENESRKLWFDFAVCLLENYRRFNDSKRFEKLYTFIIENSNENKHLYEAKYQYGILLSMQMDYLKLEELLIEYEIEEKNEYSYFFVKKAFLYSIINTQNFLDLIIPTINKGLSVCTVDQMKTLLYEILFYYARSADSEEADHYKLQMDDLKAQGYYTIGSIIDELLKYKEEDNVIPKGSDKYTIKEYLFGSSNYNKQFDHSLKLNEFIIKSGILPTISIKYHMSVINQNKWFELNNLFYSWYPEHILFQSLTYGQSDSDQKYSQSVFQIICNSSELTYERKLKIFNQLWKLFDYYYSKKEFEPLHVVLSGISMLSEVIEYKDWKNFWMGLWSLQNKDEKIENLFYRGHWGWSKQIRRMLPFVENKNDCIIKFLKPEINDDNFVIYNYCFSLLMYTALNNKPNNEFKNLIKSKGITYSNLLILYSIRDFLNDKTKEWLKERLIKQGYDKLEKLFDLILDLYPNEKFIAKSIKKHLLKNRENLIFFTGISDDLNSRSGVSPIDISRILSEISFTKKEIISIFKDLENAITKINHYNDKRKEYLSNFYYENGIMFSIMLEFIYMNRKILKGLNNFEVIKNQIYKGIERLGIKINNNWLDDKNILSDDGNVIYYFLEMYEKAIEYYPLNEPKILWALLLTKILKTEAPKFHVAFEFLNRVLNKLNEKNKWIRKYKEFYDIILTHYFEMRISGLDFEDKQFIIKKSVELATILKDKYKMESEIIQKWIDYKNESEYMTVRKMKL